MKTSNLQMTEEQEKELLTYLTKRHDSLTKRNGARIEADSDSWDIYEQNRQDRADPDSIFGVSNVPVPMTQLIVDHFVARTEDDLTGTAPYIKFDPHGPSMVKSAQDFDKYFNWKIEEQGQTRAVYEDAFLSMYVQRYTILKAIYKENSSRWLDREKKALFNLVTGEFEKVFDEGYIIEGEAKFVDGVDKISGGPIVKLESDPSFVMEPGVHEFRPLAEGVWMEETFYKGPKAVEVEYNRILLPYTGHEDLDIFIELYDKPMTWVEDMWLQRDWVSLEKVRNLGKDASAKTDKDVEHHESSYAGPEEELDFDQQDPVVAIREVWLRRDVLGLGFPQDVMIFWEPKSETLLYYEFAGMVTPDGKHPYSIVKIGKEKSLIETLGPYQDYIDKQFNSESYRNELSANVITGVNRQAFEEEPDDLIVHPGMKVDLKDGHALSDAIQHSVMPNADLRTQELIDFIFGIVQLWLGVSNLAQGDYQALAPANTATGVEATLREASKISGRWKRKIIRAIEDNLDKLVLINADTLDEDEVYEFMEGDVRSFETISPSDIRDLDVKITLVLTQNSGQREIEKADMALKIQERYFNYPPPLRPFARPLLVRMLEQLGFEQVDELLPEETPDVPLEEGPGTGDTTSALQGMGNSNTAGANQHAG